MIYPSYLIHYNKNHSKTNGQFVSGDGDGDGISNDHKNQKEPVNLKKIQKMGSYDVYKLTKKMIDKKRSKLYGVNDSRRKYNGAIGEKSAEMLRKREELSKEADEYAKKKASKNKKLDEYDELDIAEEYFWKKYDPRSMTYAYLLDLGYSEQGANLVAEKLSGTRLPY